MGLQIHATLTCDKDLTTTVQLDDPDGPLPSGWLKVEGYANTSGGGSAAIVGYFCPASVLQFPLRDLVKTAADVSPELDPVPNQPASK